MKNGLTDLEFYDNFFLICKFVIIDKVHGHIMTLLKNRG